MIRISQLKLPIDAPVSELKKQLCSRFAITEKELLSWEIIRRSLDARRGRAFLFSYTVEARIAEEDRVWKKLAGQRDLERRPDAPALIQL